MRVPALGQRGRIRAVGLGTHLAKAPTLLKTYPIILLFSQTVMI